MPQSKRPHTIADHLYGEDHGHTHDGEEDLDHDHDHDDFGQERAPGQDGLQIQDHVSLLSVGMDIGSSGTQVIFSRLNLRRLAEDLSSRYAVVARETLFQSPVSLTPYQSEERIDEAALAAIIDRAYEEAGVHADQVDAGVVILTGEALRRENSEAIAALLAEQGGEFVCASAGHHMEAMLAAYGSGAVAASHDAGKRILNVDIGGGTTKLALVERGRVTGTAAIHIGGRLQAMDERGRIIRLDPTGRSIAAEAGCRWQRGDVAAPADLERVAKWMADTLLAAILMRAPGAGLERWYLTEPLPDSAQIDGVMFSGGVAEYVYRRETRDFCDMGRRFGEALRAAVDAGALPWPLLPPGECIRATALGASEYSVQLSGNTVYVSDPATLLPRKNLQVLQPTCPLDGEIDSEAVARAVRAHFAAFDLEEGEREVALAFRWQGPPRYERIAAFARGLKMALAGSVAAGKPLFVVLDGDIAQTLGSILHEEMRVSSEVLVIDGVTLWDFDYVDLGRIRLPSQTVPVTVKSLVFKSDPRRPRGRARGHRRGNSGHRHENARDRGVGKHR
jgi:ethanolamine utilization protein EutA